MFYLFIICWRKITTLLYSCKSVTKRMAVHNISDSECLKGYYLCLKLGQFITAKEGGGGDMMFCVSVYHLNFVFCQSLSGRTWIRTTAGRHTSPKQMQSSSRAIAICHVPVPREFERNPKCRAPPTGARGLQQVLCGFMTVMTTVNSLNVAPQLPQQVY